MVEAQETDSMKRWDYAPKDSLRWNLIFYIPNRNFLQTRKCLDPGTILASSSVSSLSNSLRSIVKLLESSCKTVTDLSRHLCRKCEKMFFRSELIRKYQTSNIGEILSAEEKEKKLREQGNTVQVFDVSKFKSYGKVVSDYNNYSIN